MKTKMTKKVFAVLIAMALVFGMALTAFAVAGDGSLTVTGDKEFVGKTVSAYQVFTASWVDTNNDDNIDGSDTVSYVLNSAWEGFFTDTMLTGITGVSKSDKAAKYVAGLNEAGILQLAKDMKAYANTNNIAATYTSGAATATTAGGSVTITGMTPGYYLVIPQSGSTNTTRKTDATLVNVPSAASAAWAIKSQYPTVEKTVGSNQKTNTAQIGDVLDFTLTSAVPDMTEYTTYYFAFHDTLSKGLTYDVTTGVTVTIDGDTVDSSKYTVTYTPDTTNDNNSGQLDVVFTDLKAEYAAKEGKAIVVTYRAMLNENAVIASTGNKNNATVEYSNDPGTDNKGTSTPTETTTYTYELTIDKHDNSATPVQLAGAVFELLDNSDSIIKLIPTGTANEYRVANATEIAETTNNQTVETVTTPNTGLVKIKGLKVGTYKLRETVAPTGYNKLADDIVVVITESDGTPTYSVGGTAQANSPIANVVNSKGSMLPTTGGIGTIGLTVLGVGVVIFGFVFTSKKKKKAE